MSHSFRISINSRLLFPLLALVYLLAVIISHRVFFYLFYSLMALIAVSYFWSRHIGQRISLSREARREGVQVGEKLREKFAVTNRSRLPVFWVEMVDRSNLPGYQASRVESMGGGARRTWDAETVCWRRGLYTLGPVDMRTGDPFGLFSARWREQATRSLLVYPRIVDLPGIDLPSGTHPGSARTSLRTQQVTTSASTVREYVPGDSLNRIHWLSTVRHGRLIVKEFDLEPSGNAWVVLDLEERVQAGEGDESTEEYGVILTASLAYKLLEQNKAVGLAAFGRSQMVLQPDRGPRQLGRILKELAVAKAEGRYPLSEVLTRFGLGFGRGMTVVVITPSWSLEWAAGLLFYAAQGMAPAAVVMNPRSFGGRQTSDAVVEALIRSGITTYTISRGQRFTTVFRERPRQEAAYRVLATGRVIAPA